MEKGHFKMHSGMQIQLDVDKAKTGVRENQSDINNRIRKEM